jgi:hypothetical protein
MPIKAPPELSAYHHNTLAPVDFRAAARRAEEERAHSRMQELELQTSASRSPEERIRIWERRHALRLPASAGHPLVWVIAENTQLTVRAVRDEQQRRGESSDGSKHL